MIKLTKKNKCCGCNACAQICPVHCITMQTDEEGFWYPCVDEAKCIQCGRCEIVCPTLCAEATEKGTPKSYAAYNLNEDVRRKSSSGGIFTLLAEYVLAQNGAVYGAALTRLKQVEHIRVTDSVELEKLRGSKYVQSNIGNTFIQAKQDLEAGIPVLFTGTPCQIEGLRAFLGKEYMHLTCMDIICHGVPSPMVWQKYVAHQEAIVNSEVVDVSFRDKRNGWKNFGVAFSFNKASEYVRFHQDDLFMRAFLSNLCLRPSCYECTFKKKNRISDITVADFWGIQDVCPEMDDDKGTSLVIVHSGKGETMLNAIQKNMRFQKVDFAQAIRGNPSMIRSVVVPEKRDVFLKEVQAISFDRVVNRYAISKINVKSILKRILIKIKLWDTVKKFRDVLCNQNEPDKGDAL